MLHCLCNLLTLRWYKARLYDLEGKITKSFSDFSHYVVRNGFLRSAIAPYRFSVAKCNADYCFNIKRKGAQKVITRLLQCRRVYLRNDGGNFLFCDFFRDLAELRAVFSGFSAVSVLRTSAAKIAVIIRLKACVTCYHWNHSCVIVGWFWYRKDRERKLLYFLPTSFHKTELWRRTEKPNAAYNIRSLIVYMLLPLFPFSDKPKMYYYVIYLYYMYYFSLGFPTFFSDFHTQFSEIPWRVSYFQ